MNITWRLLERTDHKWGVQEPNGSFNGMVGSIEKGDADMIATPISFTASRHTVADYGVSKH